MKQAEPELPTLLYLLQQPLLDNMRIMGRYQETGHIEMHTEVQMTPEELILRSRAGHSIFFDLNQRINIADLQDGGGFWAVDNHKRKYRLVPFALAALI